MACVPGEFFDHRQQSPSHAHGPFAGIVLGVVAGKTKGDRPRSLAGTLVLGDHIGQCSVVRDGGPALVSLRVTVAFGFLESRPEPLRTDPFCGGIMLDQGDRSRQRRDQPLPRIGFGQAAYGVDSKAGSAVA